MKLSKVDKILIILFISIVTFSIYNDKIKNKEVANTIKVKEEKVDDTFEDDEYKLVDENYYYELYEKDYNNGVYGYYYKYIIYSKDKEIIGEEEIDRYTYITSIDNIVEVRINYGTKAKLSKLYDIKNGKKLLEKQNVYLYNDKYVVILNITDIEIQDIENKDKYYKKIKLSEDIINNLISMKFTDKNKKLKIKYIDGDKEKEYSIDL